MLTIDNQPLVSIGLPTYNRCHSLKRAIESVLQQDYQHFELLISDNASPDETATVCSEFSARDCRVTYHRQSENLGPTANFLSVLKRARGEYFMWFADDDWLDPSYLSECVRVLQADPAVVLVGGDARYFEGETHSYDGVKMNLLSDSPVERVVEFYRQVHDNATFYGLARRQQLLEIPFQNVLGGDWLFVASLAVKGKIVTLDHAGIVRSIKGVSNNLKKLAMSLGMTERRAERPWGIVCRAAVDDILSKSPIFRSLGLLTRITLALRVAKVFYDRFLFKEHPVPVKINRLRYRLKLRTRLRRVFQSFN